MKLSVSFQTRGFVKEDILEDTEENEGDNERWVFCRLSFLLLVFTHGNLYWVKIAVQFAVEDAGLDDVQEDMAKTMGWSEGVQEDLGEFLNHIVCEKCINK